MRERAIRHFKVGAERRTHGRTGVLIYLSMREHRAEIVADEAIPRRSSPKSGARRWPRCWPKSARAASREGIAAGVREVGEVLAAAFPARARTTGTNCRTG